MHGCTAARKVNAMIPTDRQIDAAGFFEFVNRHAPGLLSNAIASATRGGELDAADLGRALVDQIRARYPLGVRVPARLVRD